MSAKPQTVIQNDILYIFKYIITKLDNYSCSKNFVHINQAGLLDKYPFRVQYIVKHTYWRAYDLCVNDFWYVQYVNVLELTFKAI